MITCANTDSCDILTDDCSYKTDNCCSNYIQTSDGRQNCGTLPDTVECCPRPLIEIDRCGLMCSFVELLPNGPLWDVPKARALAWLRSGDCAQTGADSPPPGCTFLS